MPRAAGSCISTLETSTTSDVEWRDTVRAWLKRFWKRITMPIEARDETRYPPQGGPYGGPLK